MHGTNELTGGDICLSDGKLFEVTTGEPLLERYCPVFNGAFRQESQPNFNAKCAEQYC